MIKKIYILLIVFFTFFNFAYATSNIRNETIIKNNVCEVKAFDSDSDKLGILKLNMKVKKHNSGAIYAVDFELFNDTNRNLKITSFSATNEMFRTHITVQHQQVSKAYKSYAIDGKKTANMCDIFLKPGEKIKRNLSIDSVLKNSLIENKLLQNNTEGDLLVIFSFVYYVNSNECDTKGKLTSMYLGQTEIFSLESYLQEK
ncbi:hypothetical protein [Methylovulum psychrotolerans]|uniref:Uncharacterized protein n=1 Tax=Methylovulum psychrotolerans TaxID=1704499 RepID=A0A2S5CST2_9GAMM|nr:hypothetical protein [Methylovulum psychrotolerans]POZ53797.1 hypothetical protein AADEFJLK_00838 [Methylovulum psychrotolerans]